MRIAEHWSELQFSLECLQKGNAKRQFRQAIKYSWGGLCAYCRCERATTLDHIKPRSKGGSNLRSNLVPACVKCNHSKGSQSWLTWYEQQPFYNQVVQELIQEWITNLYTDDEEHDGTKANYRAEIRSNPCSLRSREDEPTCIREDYAEAA